MPIQILSQSFTDDFGNTLPSYRANAGDRVTMSTRLISSIRISSLTNPFIIDPVLKSFTLSSGSWLKEGFRVGDSVYMAIYDSNGNLVTSWNANAQIVSDTVLDVDSLPQIPNVQNGESLELQVPTKAGRGDLECLFNLVSNTNGGQEFSLIDGEVTRGIFTDTNSIIVGASQTAVLTGKKSGQFVYSISITRETSTIANSRIFRLDVVFANSGIYDLQWFDSSDCLKTLIKVQWSRDTGDVSNLYTNSFSNSANTGWFNEAFNTSAINSSLTQVVSSIDYKNASTHTIKVDGITTNIGLGACYIPTDETYYKNQTLSQSNIAMLSYTRNVSIASQVSAQNASGAGYTITVNSVTVSGTETTINFTFTPNALFFTFMDARDAGDRLFYVWVKCGNVNWLAFNNQLEYTPPPGAPINIINEVSYYDHSQNLNDGSGSDFTLNFNTEDDLGYFGSFLLEKESIYSSFVARIQAYNPVTGADITLLQAVFDFTGVPYSSDGRYLLNEVIAINTILPLTSLKREAKLYLEPSLDTSTEYGVSIYFPFILRWEYWLQQLNASVDFWPNQNKNWLQYDNTGDWEVRLQLELNDDLSHTYEKEIVILDYDSETDLKNDISLKIESTGQTVGIIVEGELMRVTATHEILNAYVWNPSEIWGQITVEPYEGGPRWMVSTAVPTDGNVLNPLNPISGTLVNITYLSPKIAKMECFFDPSKIDLSKGCKFTSKIKGCQGEPVKTMTDGTTKTMTDETSKTIAL